MDFLNKLTALSASIILIAPSLQAQDQDSVIINKKYNITAIGSNERMELLNEDPITLNSGNIYVLQNEDTIQSSPISNGKVEFTTQVKVPAYLTAIGDAFIPEAGKRFLANHGNAKDVNAFFATNKVNIEKDLEATIYNSNGSQIASVPVTNLGTGIFQLYYDFDNSASNKMHIVSIPDINQSFKFIPGQKTYGPSEFTRIVQEKIGSHHPTNTITNTNLSNGRTSETDINKATIVYEPSNEQNAFASSQEVTLTGDEANIIQNVVMKYYLQQNMTVRLQNKNVAGIELMLTKRSAPNPAIDIITEITGGSPNVAIPGVNIIFSDGSMYRGSYDVSMINVEPRDIPVGFRPLDDGALVLDRDPLLDHSDFNNSLFIRPQLRKIYLTVGRFRSENN